MSSSHTATLGGADGGGVGLTLAGLPTCVAVGASVGPVGSWVGEAVGLAGGGGEEAGVSSLVATSGGVAERDADVAVGTRDGGLLGLLPGLGEPGYPGRAVPGRRVSVAETDRAIAVAAPPAGCVALGGEHAVTSTTAMAYVARRALEAL